MQNLNALRQELFSEAMSILNRLSKIDEVEELILQTDNLNALSEKVSFLKLLKQLKL